MPQGHQACLSAQHQDLLEQPRQGGEVPTTEDADRSESGFWKPVTAAKSMRSMQPLAIFREKENTPWV